MDVETANEIEQVLQRLNSWSANDKLTLVQRVLETLKPSIAQTEHRTRPRGRPVSELIGLGAGKNPPPDDDQVKEWIHEHRMEKYG